MRLPRKFSAQHVAARWVSRITCGSVFVEEGFLKGWEVSEKLDKKGSMARIQYHATSWDRVPSILAKGLLPPRTPRDVATNVHAIPSISTTNDPKDAQVYHPQGALLELRVKPGAKYLKRSPRDMHKGENLQESVNRWLAETQAKGADGFWIEGWQSTVGNQTLNPRALEVVRVVNAEDSPTVRVVSRWLREGPNGTV